MPKEENEVIDECIEKLDQAWLLLLGRLAGSNGEKVLEAGNLISDVKWALIRLKK